MGDIIELTLNSPLTDEDWDKIMDIEFENTKSITFRTKSGKTVEFAKVSEEFEWCHDCKEYDAKRHCCPRWTNVIRKTVEELKQGRPKGKWIKPTGMMPPEHHGHYECSECGFWAMRDWARPWKGVVLSKFCPHCGADMRVVEHEND